MIGSRGLRARVLFSVGPCLFLIGMIADFRHAASNRPDPDGKTVEGFRRAFGPSGDVKVSKPTLTWEVWPGSNCSLQGLKMVVNGSAVACTYDSETRRLTYRPDQPLSPGSYSVSCVAWVDGRLKLAQDWTFNIENPAIANLGPLTLSQASLVAEVDLLRENSGLDDAEPNPTLSAAAKAHSDYLESNHRSGHFEVDGETGFIGKTISDRLNAFGWVGGAYEDVGFESSADPTAIVDDLFAAPYHRIAFLQPGNVSIGVGASAHRATLEFSISNKSGLVHSPYDSSHPVPPSWDGLESPSPLKLHGAEGPVGYPIVVVGFGDDNVVSTGNVVLKDSNGQEIPCFLNTPETDSHLDSALIAIPKRPLPAGIYSVQASVILANGSPKSLSWQFAVSGQPNKR